MGKSAEIPTSRNWKRGPAADWEVHLLGGLMTMLEVSIILTACREDKKGKVVRVLN
jgi:hypothetical protein